MKPTDLVRGIRAIRKLQDLQAWYERGYRDHQTGISVAFRINAGHPSPDQRTAYDAGRFDAEHHRPMKGMLD